MPKIAIVLTNGYADWECAFLNGIGNSYYGVETLNAAPAGQTVVSQGGLTTIPSGSVEEIEPNEFDCLVICGGVIWESTEAPDITKTILDFLKNEKYVAAICGGTLALANAGILNDIHHTSNTLEFLKNNSTIYNGASNYIEDHKAVIDKRIITAAGSAPASFTAEIFRAVGIADETVKDFLKMLSAEHMS